MAIRYLSGINVDSNTLFVNDANNLVGIGTGSPAGSLHIQKNSGNYSNEAIKITGTPLSNVTDGTSATEGYGLYLSYNISGNRQFVFADTVSGNGVRYIGTSLDGFNKITQSREDLNLGTETNGVHVAAGISNTQFSVSNVGGTASKIVTEIKGAASQTGNYLNISSSGAQGDIVSVFSSGNVGIGTTTDAGRKLDVAGNISLDEYLYHRDSTAQYLRFIDTSTIQLQSAQINFSLGSTSSPQGGDFQFASPNGSDFTVSYTRTGQAVWKQKFVNQTMYWENNVGSIVYFANNDGNVGIGTTSPNRTLTVIGTKRHERVYAYANNTFNLTNDISLNTVWLHLGTQASFTTDKIYYRVGTSTSEEEGEIIVKNTCGTANIEWHRNSYNVMVTAVKARMQGSCQPCEIWIQVRYGSNYGGASTNIQWQVQGGTDSNFVTVNNTGTPGTGTNEANIASTDGYIVANSDNQSIGGSLGVGTTSPGSRIEISGTTGSYNSGIGFVPSGTGSRNYRTFIATDGSFRFDDATAGATRTMLTSGGNLLIGTTTDAGYKLYVSGTGTSTNLAVVGNIRAGGTGTAGGEIIASGALGNGNFVSLRHDDTNAYITVTRAVYDGHLILQPYGNVGLGTSSPNSKFVVRRDVTDSDLSQFGRVQLELAGSTDSNKQLLVGFETENNYGFIQTLAFGTSWSTYNLALQWKGGNVFIGNTAGSGLGERLNVTGNGIAIEATDGGITTLMGTFGGTDSIIGTYTNNNLQIRTNNTSRIFITSGGNVLVGTTTDAGFKLYVNGGARFDGELFTSLSNGVVRVRDNGTAQVELNIRHSSTRNGVVSFTQDGVADRWAIGTKPSDGTLYFSSNFDLSTPRLTLTSAGNVGIGTTTPASPLQVSAASVLSQGTLSIVNTYASGGVYFPTARFIQQRGDHSFGIVSEFYTGATSGTDRPSILFNTGNSSNSWQVGMVTSGWGGNDSFGIGYRASNDPASFNTWPTARFLITTGGNVLINTTTDNGSTLRVNGTIYADSTITSATSVRAVEGYFNPYTSAGNIATPVYQDAIFLGPLDNDCTIQFGNEFQSTHGSYIRFRTNSPSAQNTPVNVMTMFPNGKVALNQYGAGTFTSGTVAYNLGVDSAGNIMELPGGVVDGSGTANYVTKWQDANTVTNSQIVDNGTNVGINNTSPKTKLDVNGTIGFGSKTMSMTDTFAAALTLNMNDHTGCYVKITAFGDWGNHSTIAYLGEFFVQASAGGYNEPGIIIRQVDNTGGGDDIQARILDPAGAGTRDFIIELKATSSANTPFTAHIQYEVRGQYNSVS
jgi:hypothetical protein